MFSFLKNIAGVQNNPQLQAHAEKVFGMVRVIQQQLFIFILSFIQFQ